MKLSEWKLKMTDGVSSVLAKLSGAGDKVSAKFGGLQDKISKAGDAAKGSGMQIPFLSNAFGKLEGMAGQASGAMGNVIQSLLSVKHPVALVVAGLAILAAALIGPINKAGDFEQSMAEVSAITGIAGKDLDHLSKKSLEVGAATGLGAMKAAEAYKLLASNIDVATIGGVKGLDLLQEKTITLAQAAGVDLAMAADTMAATINQFSFKATDAGRVINALAAGAKYGAAEIPDLAESLKITGSTAAIAKVSLEDTIGALEILSQNAVKGSEAGTGLRNVLIALQTKTKFLPGIDLRADGLMKSLVKLKPHLKDTVLLAHLFGRENINAAQLLIQNAKGVEEMGRKVTGTNIAYEQAAIQTNTYNGSINRLKGTMESISIKIGSAFLPVVTKGINALTSGIASAVNWMVSLYNKSQIIQDIVWLIGKNFQLIGGIIKWAFFKPMEYFWTYVLKPMLKGVEWLYDKTKALLGLGSEEKATGNLNSGGIMRDLKSDAVTGGGTSTAGSATEESDAEINKTSGKISDTGRSVRNITLNFNNLVEKINITPQKLDESKEDIVRFIEETILRAIRGAELASERQ